MAPAVRDPLRGLVRLGGIAAVYAAACGVMLAPICNFRALASSTYGGDARLVAWALAWDNRALSRGLPLFDANIFFPAREALAYGEHFFGISLFSLPVYLSTRNAALGYNVVWILSYLLTALALHWMAWRMTRDHLAAIVAGLAGAFCFFRMHHGHGHLHLLWVFWIPAALMAMERWIAQASWKWLAAFAAIVVLQALSSWYQAVLVFVAATLWMAWLVVLEPALEGRWPWTLARLGTLAVQSAVGGAAALLAVWPFARHYHLIAPGGPREAAGNSADLAAYLMPPENTLIGRWMLRAGIHGPRWIWGELTLYLGAITIALAIAGAAIAIRGGSPERRRLRFFVLLAAAALALAAGPNSREIAENTWHWSVFGALAHIPGADLFRAPARFAALLTMALAVLAAGACAALHRRFGVAGRIATCALVPLMLAEFYVVDFPGGVPEPFPVPGVYRALASLPPGPAVSLPDYQSTPQWFREPDYQYFSTAHWHPIANGYSRAAPAGFQPRMDRFAKFPDDDALSALREGGIRYVIVHAADYAGGTDAVRRAHGDSRLRLLMESKGVSLFEIAAR